MKSFEPENKQLKKRRQPGYRGALYWALVPIVALALMFTSVQATSLSGAFSASLSKRFIRFNEYLFNGAEETTAIAAVRGLTNDQPLVG